MSDLGKASPTACMRCTDARILASLTGMVTPSIKELAAAPGKKSAAEPSVLSASGLLGVVPAPAGWPFHAPLRV